MNSFVYIPIKNNSKISAVQWKNIKSTHHLCAKYTNRAILTGQLSNIIVVDVDDLSVWAEYLKTHRTPETLHAFSPKGMHFYFKYHPSLAKSLVNIRKGIDIRSNGGYILCEPSIVNDMYYKFVKKIQKSLIFLKNY